MSSVSSSSTGPVRPQNSAAAPIPQQQQLQRIGINICVNHPIGAPQFAAISSITETADDNENNNDKNNNTNINKDAPVLLSDQQSTSLFTAFPHDRGTFDGLVLNRSLAANNNNNNNKVDAAAAPSKAQHMQQRVRCFSTWASSTSYKAFFSLSTSDKINNNDRFSDADDDEDDDEDENNDGDDDDDEAGGGGDDDDEGVSGNNNNNGSRKPKRRQRGGGVPGKKKNHWAFKRVPEKLAEAWFVLSPATVDNNTTNTISNNSTTTTTASLSTSSEQVVTSYDMLPLMEVFSCQKKLYNEAEKHRGDKKKVPQLTVNVPLTRLTLSQKYTKDFFKKKF